MAARQERGRLTIDNQIQAYRAVTMLDGGGDDGEGEGGDDADTRTQVVYTCERQREREREHERESCWVVVVLPSKICSPQSVQNFAGSSRAPALHGLA